MEKVNKTDSNFIEIVNKNSLPFVIERIDRQTITLNPRIQGVGKKHRKKFKNISRVCEISVISEEKIKRFESIVVTYPEHKGNNFESIFDKIISTANKQFKKLQ